MLAVYGCLGLIFILTVQGFTLRAKLPSYIDQCSRSASDLNKCFIKAANKVIPRIVKGDDHYNIPNMLPLKKQSLVIRNDQTIRFFLQNVQIHGLQNTTMTDVNVTTGEVNYFEEVLTNPKLTVLADYFINGRIVNVPIEGLGKANITILNPTCVHGFNFVLDEKQYGNISGNYAKCNVGRILYNLTGLFPGHKFLGYQMNAFLNNNWREVSIVFRQGALQGINSFLTYMYNAIGQIVPFDEIFLP